VRRGHGGLRDDGTLRSVHHREIASAEHVVGYPCKKKIRQPRKSRTTPK
jgi:hypothetical protein